MQHQVLHISRGFSKVFFLLSFILFSLAATAQVDIRIGGSGGGGGGGVSGTTNRIAYFDTPTSVTSASNLYWDASGKNLGIGTTTPHEKMTVNGDLVVLNSSSNVVDSSSAARIKSSIYTPGVFVNYGAPSFSTIGGGVGFLSSGQGNYSSSSLSAWMGNYYSSGFKFLLSSGGHAKYNFILGGLGGMTQSPSVLTSSKPSFIVYGSDTLTGADYIKIDEETFTVNDGNYNISVDGNLGISNASPTEKLDVTGNVKFSGALMPGGSAGTSGQVLTSQGTGLAPVWSTPSSSGISSIKVSNTTKYLGLIKLAYDSIGLDLSSIATGSVGTNFSFAGYDAGLSSNTRVTFDGLKNALDDEFFRNGGNSFGASATLGTNDANSLIFETNNTPQVNINTSGEVTFNQYTSSNAVTGTPTAMLGVTSGGKVVTVAKNRPDTVYITLNALNPGQALTQTAGTDFYDGSWLVPEHLDGYTISRVDYALTTNTSTTGSLTIGFRWYDATNTSTSFNNNAVSFSGSEKRKSSTVGGTLVKNYWMHPEVHPSISGTLDGTVEGLLITLMLTKQ